MADRTRKGKEEEGHVTRETPPLLVECEYSGAFGCRAPSGIVSSIIEKPGFNGSAELLTQHTLRRCADGW